jgi:hypothetical protein
MLWIKYIYQLTIIPLRLAPIALRAFHGSVDQSTALLLNVTFYFPLGFSESFFEPV